ncbi:hypothetical protein TVAG_252600 [Trichomonas vaginalis G3]|uniref:KAT8 regulatory NSL complex subunit 2 n=1 Tax=Trichomonas vaginalis (strain ATCC PRA-98 / G3) TaxID=412133 RepID=A2DW02_TRIV3|nr:putative DNA-binding domain family [Trichomonas vaginalis G3]EAY15447.1 hypothetical protein TVAG_252600 [Trichomonas vaginalis G3]KAI5499568.1 putative DNA-binding domain family [Trichomonas vaginalis G3]|eukprot:XP_001327670.1 hypothetical protein [Trichomonas vaginalis G3]
MENQMNPKLAQIFNERGMPLPTEDPPKNAIETDFNIKESGIIKKCESLEENSDLSNGDFARLRHHYLNQDIVNDKTKDIQKQLNEIENLLENGTESDIEQLYKQRHEWRKTIKENRGEAKICCVEDCINTVVPSSLYCANHILRDPNQKAYQKCEKCNRPYIAAIGCLSCKE